MVSIITKKGFNQSGAPPGKRPAADDLGACENPLIMRPNQRGSPNLKVKSKWPVKLKI